MGVFSSVQCAWTKHCNKCLAKGVSIDWYNCIYKYMEIHSVIILKLVQKAFNLTLQSSSLKTLHQDTEQETIEKEK